MGELLQYIIDNPDCGVTIKDIDFIGVDKVLSEIGNGLVADFINDGGFDRLYGSRFSGDAL